jgi:glycerate kinase
MNILISPQAFKGSISATEVANNIEKGILKSSANHKTIKLPIADGGDDTLQTLVDITNGQIYETNATGPDGEIIKTQWGALGDGKTAVIEMAKISGLALIKKRQLDPFLYTSYGMGEVIKNCLDRGYRKFIIGIGGSATNDGGLGMAQALGAVLKDQNGNIINKGISGLENLMKIDISNMDCRIEKSVFQIACDVNNPLYGLDGATYVFGPQKGIKKQQLETVDMYMKNYGNIIDKLSKNKISSYPGSGAAGGIGAATMFFLNANLQSGSEIILDFLEFEKKCKGIDLIITGEGQIDFQTLNNKAPIAVAKIAKKHNIPVYGICGILGKNYKKVFEEGIHKVYPLCNNKSEIEYAIKNAGELIQKKAIQLISEFSI